MSASGLLIVIVINGNIWLSELHKYGLVFSASAIRLFVSHVRKCVILCCLVEGLKMGILYSSRRVKAFQLCKKLYFNKVKRKNR